jgi:hypothetical protein
MAMRDEEEDQVEGKKKDTLPHMLHMPNFYTVWQ